MRELYRFDPAELAVMPNSVDGGEPDQFLALKIARDALVDAGCFDNYDHTNTGIVLGHSTYLHRGSGVMVQHGVVVDQTVQLIRQLISRRSARRRWKSCAPRWWRNCRRSIPTPRQASCPML